MKIRNRNLFLAAGVLLFAVASGAGMLQAQDSQDTTDNRQAATTSTQTTGFRTDDFTVDGKTVTAGQVISDFLNIAFSEKLWNKDMSPEGFEKFIARLSHHYTDIKSEEVQKNYRALKEHAPWLADYMYRPDGFPRQNVINKWTKEISIGIDWPVYAPQYAAEGAQGLSPYSEALIYPGLDKSYQLIAEQIEALVPKLRELTGLPVRFVKPGDPDDRTDKYARIRIVPIQFTGLNNAFKTLRYSEYRRSRSEKWDIRDNEDMLWGGVQFTPSARAQVDGYLLPNIDNTLGMTVCKITPAVGQEMMRALISECLVRALGIPGTSEIADQSLLGNWNKENDPYSKLPALDGDKAAVSSDKFSKPPKYEFLVPDPVKNGKLQTFTSYDELMISLLYCEKVKPGMGPYDAVQIIADCLNRPKTNSNKKEP